MQLLEIQAVEGISEYQQTKEKLFQIDESLGNLFVKLQQDFEALEFVKRDVEMRTKIKDIWELQCRTMKSILENSFQQFVELCQHHGWAIDAEKRFFEEN